MDLFSKKNIKTLISKHQARPSKRLGQNFLADKNSAKKAIEAAYLKVSDVVVEIGPGLGALTSELAKKAGKVIAIEKDPKMIEILKETLADFNNIEIIQADIRQFQRSSFIVQRYKVIANLPFYLAAPVIRNFLEAEKRPEIMVFIIQKEVARRICAKPPDMNLLAVSVQFYARPEIISYVSKKSFWPQPKVDAALIKIIPSENPDVSAPLFFKVAKAGFSHPRKQLLNNLSKGLKIDKEKTASWLKENGISPEKRAETLTLQDWIKLSKSCL